MPYAADATPPFYHGTRADLAPGDWLTPGNRSNYADRKLSWIYFSGTLDAAIWGCELARGEGRERIYLVEPTGAFDHVILYGAVRSSPTFVVSRKNSTLVIDPVDVLAVAFMTTVAGATYVAPLAGAVSVTVGGGGPAAN